MRAERPKSRPLSRLTAMPLEKLCQINGPNNVSLYEVYDPAFRVRNFAQRFRQSSGLFALAIMVCFGQVARGQESGQDLRWTTPDGTRHNVPTLSGASGSAGASRTTSANAPKVRTLSQPPQSARAFLQQMRPAARLALQNASFARTVSDTEQKLDTDSVLGGLGPSEDRKQGGIPGAGHGVDDAKASDFPEGLDPHAEAFAETAYPSAHTCATCHQKIFDEWSVSAHAYAAVSPMFHAFEQKIADLSQGTIGSFCVRCHAPIATQMGLPRGSSMVDQPYVFREGVTCVACHRVKTPYGRVNGERRVEPGPLQDPVYGSIGGDGVAKAIENKDDFKIKLDPSSKKPGQEIHFEGIKFEQLSSSGFCQPCHQVAVHPGIALEVVWAQYRSSPAFKKGITCQDCHMGAIPGKPHDYEYGPAAEMSGKWVDPMRKHSNHVFYGPGNSIAHPGIFPHNAKALRWNVDQWMAFDWRAGWGTKDFEAALKAGKIPSPYFPKPWDTVDDRRDARKVLDENFKLLAYKKQTAKMTMEAGAQLEGPYFRSPPRVGSDLSFHYNVRSTSEGHNLPSGSLGAQPQLWLNVVLTGPSGQRLWESGYLDPNGDLANQHSLYVADRKIRPDQQLFNLQTQFLITGVKGPDREMYLPVNIDIIDQLAFLRPGNIPVSVMNHPPFIRMEAKSITPLGVKVARYSVPGHLMRQPGEYKISARLRSRMEPIYFMKFCGATPEMQNRMLEQTLDLHEHTRRIIIE